MKKHIAILLSLFLLKSGCFNLMSQVSFGKSEKFNEGWKFILNPERNPDEIGDNEWENVSIPHDWSIKLPMDSTLAAATGFLPGGKGIYRKNFIINDSLKNHYVYFEGIYNRSKVYVNDSLIGERPNGYVSTLYDMTPYLKEGINTIDVYVDHSRQADSRWYTGSGIYRDVWIIGASDTHVAPWGICFETLKIEDDNAAIKIGVDIDNPIDNSLNIILKDNAGKIVADTTLVANESNDIILNVRRPELWSITNPNLYELGVAILDKNGEIIDSTCEKVGIRTLNFDADKGFFLNGENIKIKGVCLHHDAGVLGAAVPKEVWERRLKNLKSIGVNAIRMSHNPQSPDVYDLCDELGLMVMDEASDEWEFPKRKWIKGWNVGEPGYEGSYDFFEEWIERDVADMVRRDRLHPSIIMWSIGNEVDYPNDPYSHPILNGAEINQPMFGGYKPDAPDATRIGEIAMRLARVVRDIDDSRPVTGALAGVVMSNETAYPDAVDVVGYNYTENRYDMDHSKYPQRIIYGSENSSTYDAWKAVKDRDFISGQFIWTGTDYLGESNGWPARGFYTGLLDFGSFTKPRGQFRASLWKDEPFIYIGTYIVPDDDPVLHPAEAAMHLDRKGPWLSIDADDTWNYEEGDIIRVVCYTNTPYAQLFLNGKEVGKKTAYDEEIGIIYWDIPFSAGILKVEGMDSTGEVVANYSIVTTDIPQKLVAYLDDDTSGSGVRHVVVDIVDKNGERVKNACNEITCDIEGDGILLGLENSDNNDTGDFTDNVQHAYKGRLLAYIKKGNEPVIIKFSSPGLEETYLEIK